MNVNIDISNVILRTERLVLRAWNLDDLEDFYEYASVEGVGERAGWHHHKSIDESKEILNHFIEGKKTFAIEYRSKVIGSLGIEKYDEDQFPEYRDKKARELGFVLSKDYWGLGIMTEAVNSVIKYLFEEVKLDIIFCGHFLENKLSARVQEKCGFKYLKIIDYKTRMGTMKKSRQTILLKEDYFKL